MAKRSWGQRISDMSKGCFEAVGAAFGTGGLSAPKASKKSKKKGSKKKGKKRR